MYIQYIPYANNWCFKYVSYWTNYDSVQYTNILLQNALATTIFFTELARLVCVVGNSKKDFAIIPSGTVRYDSIVHELDRSKIEAWLNSFLFFHMRVQRFPVTSRLCRVIEWIITKLKNLKNNIIRYRTFLYYGWSQLFPHLKY